jgi:hypothetical protein
MNGAFSLFILAFIFARGRTLEGTPGTLLSKMLRRVR